MSEITTRYKWDPAEEVLHIIQHQDVEPILDLNKKEYASHRRGERRKSETMNLVARIPVNVVDIYRQRGIDLLNDRKALRKFLNDPDNRYFRTRPGKV